MLKTQEVTIVITYDDSTFDDPSNWSWVDVLELGQGTDFLDADVVLKGYSEAQDVIL